MGHARGIVHRDIKPDNVMIAGRRVKVLDFGVAKQIGEQHHRDFHTAVGTVVGTPEYMSPEQALGRIVDARTDIFSLGVLLYHALSGALPFSGASVTELFLKICRDEAPPFYSLRPDLPQELAKVIATCMQKDRELRYASARDLAAALERVMPRLSREALPAVNGAEAVAALKQREYALMFLDIMMPRIDGWGVLDYLRTRANYRVPALFIVTAFLDQTVAPADRELVAGILYKPIDADEIAALMRECARGNTTAAMMGRTRRTTRHRLIAAAG